MSKRNQAGQRGAGASGPERPGWLFLVAGGLIYAGTLLGMWIVLAGQPDVQDLVAGSAAAVLAVGVGYLLSQRGKMVPSIRVADLRTLAALPWQLVVETGQVFALAARKAAGRLAAPGALRTVPVDVGTDVRGWPAARREAVLTALLSAAPQPRVALGALDALGDQAGLAHYAQVVGEGRLAQLEPGLLHDLGAQRLALLEDHAVHAAREPCWSAPTRRASWRRSPAACWPVLARADSLSVIGDQALSRQANGPLSC
jgi:hypothetical protein